MFKKVNQITDAKRYRKSLFTTVKIIKQEQKKRNADGPQARNFRLPFRYSADVDLGDAKPRDVLLIGTKSTLDRLTKEVPKEVEKIKAKAKGKKSDKDKDKEDDKKLKWALGNLYWFESTDTIHLRVKGQMKLAKAKALLKRMGGHKGPVELGESSAVDEKELEAMGTDLDALESTVSDEMIDASPDDDTGDEDEGDESESESDVGDEQERFKERSGEVKSALDQLEQIDSAQAAPFRTEYATALGHAQAGRYGQALEILEDLALHVQEAIQAAQEREPSSSEPETPTGTGREIDVVLIRRAISQWEEARAFASLGVETLSGQLRAHGDPDAVDAADILEELNANFPDELDSAIDALSAAVNTNDHATIAKAASDAKAGVKSCLQYLNANKALIGLVEDNVFGTQVSISSPLSEALKLIATKLT